MGADTKIQFNLWAVLGFLVLLGVFSFTYLYAGAKEVKDKQVEVLQRVSTLEANYANIIKGIDKIVITIDSVDDKLTSHLIDGRRKAIEATK